MALWGPTHLFMIGRASFATLALMLLRRGTELGSVRRSRAGRGAARAG